jgi:hypothetical protein
MPHLIAPAGEGDELVQQKGGACRGKARREDKPRGPSVGNLRGAPLAPAAARGATSLAACRFKARHGKGCSSRQAAMRRATPPLRHPPARIRALSQREPRWLCRFSAAASWGPASRVACSARPRPLRSLPAVGFRSPAPLQQGSGGLGMSRGAEALLAVFTSCRRPQECLPEGRFASHDIARCRCPRQQAVSCAGCPDCNGNKRSPGQ